MSSASRLFPHHRFEEVLTSPDLLLARLLEDGDGADLGWLFSGHDAAAVCSWFAAYGGRRLSRRSRAFWALVLGTPAAAPPLVAEELWPL